jgi:hypothetical protein
MAVALVEGGQPYIPSVDSYAEQCLFSKGNVVTAESGGHCTILRVLHSYGFTRGFQAKVLTVTVMVPDFDTRRQTVPIPTVSRYCTYTLTGL